MSAPGRLLVVPGDVPVYDRRWAQGDHRRMLGMLGVLRLGERVLVLATAEATALPRVWTLVLPGSGMPGWAALPRT